MAANRQLAELARSLHRASERLWIDTGTQMDAQCSKMKTFVN
jgi:hypothetical protein